MTTQPARIQRRRTSGWRAPLDANGSKPIYVGRPTLYGNPFQVARVGKVWIVFVDAADGVQGRNVAEVSDEREARQTAVDNFRAMLRTPGGSEQAEFFARKLHGRNLMCWCPTGMPCHVDVLLELANQPEPAAETEPYCTGDRCADCTPDEECCEASCGCCPRVDAQGWCWIGAETREGSRCCSQHGERWLNDRTPEAERRYQILRGA